MERVFQDFFFPSGVGRCGLFWFGLVCVWFFFFFILNRKILKGTRITAERIVAKSEQ